jgi:hypothetical protein
MQHTQEPRQDRQEGRHVGGPSAPRIIAAVNAGRRLADERNTADSWDLEPPLIPVELLAAATPEETIAIMTAWAGLRRNRGRVHCQNGGEEVGGCLPERWMKYVILRNRFRVDIAMAYDDCCG